MKLFEVKNMTASSADVFIYGDIVTNEQVTEDVTPTAMQEQLRQIEGKDLNVFVNSNGGDVFAGMAIHNILKRHHGKKTGFVDGVAASIASVILMACDEIVVPQNAWVMIHRPEAFVGGNAEELVRAAEMLEGVEQSIAETYAAHSSLDKEAVLSMMCEETWLSGETIGTVFDKGVQVEKALEAVACATALKHKKMPEICNEDLTEKMLIDIALAI